MSTCPCKLEDAEQQAFVFMCLLFHTAYYVFCFPIIYNLCGVIKSKLGNSHLLGVPFYLTVTMATALTTKERAQGLMSAASLGHGYECLKVLVVAAVCRCSSDVDGVM